MPRLDLAALQELAHVRDVRSQDLALALRVGMGQELPLPHEARSGPRGVHVLGVAEHEIELEVVEVAIEVLRGPHGRRLERAETILEIGARAGDERAVHRGRVDVAQRAVEGVAGVHAPAELHGGVFAPAVELAEARLGLRETIASLRDARHVVPGRRLQRSTDLRRRPYELAIAEERAAGGQDQHARREHRDGGHRTAEEHLPALLALGLPAKVLIREHDLEEKVGEKEALRFGRRLSVLPVRVGHADPERGGHGVDDTRRGTHVLGTAGQVDAAKGRRLLERVPLEQHRDERREVVLERRNLDGEVDDGLAHRDASLARHPPHGPAVERVDQRIELGFEERARLLFRIGRDRHAPDLSALALAQITPALGETGDEVGLREDHVDGDEHLQPSRDLVEARAHLLGDALDLLLARGGEILDAERDDEAVDRLPLAILPKQIEKPEPFRLIVGARGIATGGVEDDGVVGEPPVAVAGPARAAIGSPLVERKREPGVADGGGLASARRADDHVPGELVERGATSACSEAALLQRGDGLLDLRLERVDLLATVGPRAGELLCALLDEAALDLRCPRDAKQEDEHDDDERDADDEERHADLDPERDAEVPAAEPDRSQNEGEEHHAERYPHGAH